MTLIGRAAKEQRLVSLVGKATSQCLWWPSTMHGV